MKRESERRNARASEREEKSESNRIVIKKNLHGTHFHKKTKKKHLKRPFSYSCSYGLFARERERASFFCMNANLEQFSERERHEKQSQ